MRALSKPVWTLPSSLKRAQLQKIAASMGASLSGTKPELLATIQQMLDATTQHFEIEGDKQPIDLSRNSLRVLSIDMGIRNLAYAFLTTKQNVSRNGAPQALFSKPTLHQWQRLNLTNTNTVGQRISETELSFSKQITRPFEDSSELTTIEESFEPKFIARHAYSFAKYCASLNPSHILIERQRFRTGGHSAVQEWSLRVGMLEGMLYATFQTLKEEKLLPNTTIEPILPMRVNKYWFADQDVPATGKAAKQAKIAIVSGMLRAIDSPEAAFSVSEDSRNIVENFGIKNTRKRSGDNKDVKASQKLDDMSDALLQGLAWLEWQQNRVKLLTEGVSGLGDIE